MGRCGLHGTCRVSSLPSHVSSFAEEGVGGGGGGGDSRCSPASIVDASSSHPAFNIIFV